MVRNSKFDVDIFCGGFDILAVSKQKHSREEAIEIAKIELGLPYDQQGAFPYIAMGDGFVRHRAGITEDGERSVGWWLEYDEHARSCPAWVFHNAKSKEEIIKGYEYLERS